MTSEVERIAELEEHHFAEVEELCPECGCQLMYRERQYEDADSVEVFEQQWRCPSCGYFSVAYDA